jgi:hypothetical protein
MIMRPGADTALGRPAGMTPDDHAPAPGDPGSLVARALAILEQETSQWQTRRPGESDRPGAA